MCECDSDRMEFGDVIGGLAEGGNPGSGRGQNNNTRASRAGVGIGRAIRVDHQGVIWEFG